MAVTQLGAIVGLTCGAAMLGVLCLVELVDRGQGDGILPGQLFPPHNRVVSRLGGDAH